MNRATMSVTELRAVLQIYQEAGVPDEDLRLDPEHGLLASPAAFAKLKGWRPTIARRREIADLIDGATRRRVEVVAGTDMEPTTGSAVMGL